MNKLAWQWRVALMVLALVALAGLALTQDSVSITNISTAKVRGRTSVPTRSTTGNAVFYFDNTLHKLRVSENGGTFGDLVGAGGGGTPGGSDTQLQYNNAGSFAGITGATSNGTTVTLVGPILGTPASGNLVNGTGYVFANLASKPTTLSGYGITDAEAPLTFSSPLSRSVNAISFDLSVANTFIASQTFNPSAADALGIMSTGTSSTNNAALTVLKLTYLPTGTSAAGAGPAIAFSGKTTTTTNRPMGEIDAIWTNATQGSQNSDLVFKTTSNALLGEAARITSAGNITATLFNGLAITSNGTNALNIAAGKTLTLSDNVTLVSDGTGTRTLNIGAGGTLGTGAFAAAGASLALDNLASVSINTALLAQTGVDLGSTIKPFRDLYLFGAGTYATTYLKLTGTPTSTRTVTIPDASFTIPQDSLVAHLAGTETITGAKTFSTGITFGTAGGGGLQFPSGDAGSGQIAAVTGGSNFRWGDSGNTVVFNTKVQASSFHTSGKMVTYNNVTTTGWGTPAVYGSGRSTAQTAAVSSIAAYTVGGSDGSFIVSANVNVTTSTAHTFSIEVAYTDETNTARVVTFNVQQLGGTLVTSITNVTGAGPYEGVPLHIRAKASTSITIRTNSGGTYTTVTYNAEGVIQQIA